jgi:hypothetical protein
MKNIELDTVVGFVTDIHGNEIKVKAGDLYAWYATLLKSNEQNETYIKQYQETIRKRNLIIKQLREEMLNTKQQLDREYRSYHETKKALERLIKEYPENMSIEGVMYGIEDIVNA